MSYRQSFQRTISVPYSGSKSVRVPPSKDGGSMTVHYEGTVHENVTVDVNVNTLPFDASVDECSNNVSGLTASVGAMNVAQCAAISENAEKVSKTIIDGFFHAIRTDLSTQRTELEQAVEARLILLRQQAASLRDKQKSMEEDYARTTARYQKIFSDLNNELSIRIHEVDQPIFDMVKDVDGQSDRMLHTDMIQTAITMNKESSILQAQISAATVKNHALQAMSQAQHFLTSKANTEKTINVSCIEGEGDERYFIPVCYMKTESENSRTEKKCYVPDFYSVKDERIAEKFCDRLDDLNFETQDSDSEQLTSYLQNEIATHIKNDDPHSVRVRETINKMLNK